jgi:hypothetical protein
VEMKEATCAPMRIKPVIFDQSHFADVAPRCIHVLDPFKNRLDLLKINLNVYINPSVSTPNHTEIVKDAAHE